MLAVFAAALAACGGSTAVAHTPIVFGTAGGNIVPFRVAIQPNGSVRGRADGILSRQISPARVGGLTSEIQQAHLGSRQCPDTSPDVASRYIRAGGRTVTVHGSCEPGFERAWNDLTAAVGRPTS